MKLGLESVPVILAGLVAAPFVAAYSLCKVVEEVLESADDEDAEKDIDDANAEPRTE